MLKRKNKACLVLATSLLLVFILVFSLSVFAANDDEVMPISFTQLSDDIPMVKSGLRENAGVNMAISDFQQAMGISDFEAITVKELPDSRDGVLKLSGMRVQAGQTIRREYLSLLSFVPAANTVSEASFTFTCKEFAGGAPMQCQIRILDAINYAPKVDKEESALSVSTQMGVAVYGNLVTLDPENDELTYIVTNYPTNGTLTMEDLHNGAFCYTPKDDFRGKDSFTYVVRDACGNYSYENCVQINVKEREIDMDYKDMAGHAAYNAALTAAANRWMLGELSGAGMYFSPEKTVSRGEFVAMAMKAMKIAPMSNLTETCFDDNEKIPVSVRPYIATAQEKGYVTGSFEKDGLYFHAEKPVTRAEAAVILNRMLKLATPTLSPVYSDPESVPVWADDAVAALYDAGILPLTGKGIAASSPLNRADAVVMLCESANERNK